MQKAILLLFFGWLVSIRTHAQSGIVSSSEGTNSLASFDIHLPVGVFARSQFVGAGLNYSWSYHRYGVNASPHTLIGFTFNAGGDYYFGKKVTTAGHNFHYGGYIYSYIMPGLLLNPWANGNISLTAGPTMGIYKGNSDFGFGVNFFGSYYLTKNISIGPGITYKKHAEADALWTGTIRASYSF